MHLGVFTLAMLYLVSLHLYRAYVIPEDILYSIDVSGPLMIITQKITSLAFSVHDGRHGNKDKLSDLQKRYMISRPPSLLEYLSYLFYFQGVLVGPISFYADYQAFIEGTYVSSKHLQNGSDNNNKYRMNGRPSPFDVVCYKLCVTLFWMGFHFTIKPLYPEMINADLAFIRSHGFLYRLWYMWISMLCCRAKYYVAFSLGDAICNASGLGFNGYDRDGRPRWDLVSNVHILGIEGATSFKTYIDNWNIQTAVWLRVVCYDRIPAQKRFFTFFLSAMWHGCYPGYYFTFVSGVPMSEVARKVRHRVRPYFLSSRVSQMLYNVITWVSTHIAMSYIVVPFTILHWEPTIVFYTFNTFWCVHLLCGLLFFIVPQIPACKSQEKATSLHQTQLDTSNSTKSSNKNKAE
ncbi:lysophospholipid acyltransferase 1-like isoform X2 [Dreissena polymorpha]|nr:lysophospholipid acyltransferase 1-like isoform X2 [Dreissena polymorpha]